MGLGLIIGYKNDVLYYIIYNIYHFIKALEPLLYLRSETVYGRMSAIADD